MQLPQEYCKNGKAKGYPTFYLPTFETSVDIKCFPLSYHLGKCQPDLEPNPDICCDLSTCSTCNDGNFVRLACFHTFHVLCLPQDRICPICKNCINQMVKEQAKKFNEGLLRGGQCDSEDESSDSETEHNLDSQYDNEQSDQTGGSNQAKVYYTSSTWAEKVNSWVNSYSHVAPPSYANKQSFLSCKRSKPTTATSCSTLPHVQLDPVNHGNFTTWHFSTAISQSTILGRQNGSNACTIIALLVGKLFISSPEVPDCHNPLSQQQHYFCDTERKQNLRLCQ